MNKKYLGSLFYYNKKYDYLANYLTTWSMCRLITIIYKNKIIFFKSQKIYLKVHVIIAFLTGKGVFALYFHFTPTKFQSQDFHSQIFVKTNSYVVHTAFCFLSAYHYWVFYLHGEPFTNGVLFNNIFVLQPNSVQKLNKKFCFVFQKIGFVISKIFLLI